MMRKRRSVRVENGEVRYALKGEELEAAIADQIGLSEEPANADVVNPRPHQLIQKVGSWAMITRQLPPMEFNLDEHVRVGRVFYVTPFSNADSLGFLPDGRYKVTCHTPWHELTLMPYEYTVLPPERLLSHWQEGALLFHPFDLEAWRFNDIMFYARSRGIGPSDAMVMALGTLQAPVGWFEPPPELAPELEAMAERINTPLWKHIQRSGEVETT
jgi:hypothetical protein